MFVDRLLATLVHLRHGVTRDVPACWFGVDRSTITRAIGEVRPLRHRLRRLRRQRERTRRAHRRHPGGGPGRPDHGRQRRSDCSRR
ncbi:MULTISPECIES: helix-turn-helix domain-containing protein [Streptomyces]|uniref:Transposase family protein n=2 Tax=Streptomyces TaxID=1883 RepID=A0ABU4KFS5_9ACTN|nr:transposase family protein [Streptomyces roseolus]MDX2296621.1 transposase family protein [Streptomyces roseolus]